MRRTFAAWCLALGLGLFGVPARAEPAAPPARSAPWTPRAIWLADHAVAAAGDATGNKAIARAIHYLNDTAEREDIALSVTVTPLDSGRVITSHRTAELENPASNTKLATAAYALHVLGKEHRFETELATDRGSLFVRGGFDPTLTDEVLLEAARQLHASGVTRVAGDLVLDGTRLRGERTPEGFSLYGAQRWEYLTPPAALAVDKDRYRLTVTGDGAPGDKAQASSDVRAFPIESSVVIGKPGDKTQVGIEVKPSVGEGPSTVRVWGTIAPGDRPRRLVMRSPDTLTLFGDRMQRALAAAGITVEGRVRAGDTPSTATPVHVVRSAPLGEILRASLGGSIEFDHETFAVAAAHAQNGRQPVTVADGVAGLRAFLASEVKLERFVVKNASGLGNVNRLSSHDIAKLLRYAAAHDRTAPMLDALARPGAPHTTLVTRMIGTEAETALAAKTGTEGRNIALSGVVHPPQGRPVVFSTIASSRQRPEARAIVDSVGITLSRLRASPPPAVAAPRP